MQAQYSENPAMFRNNPFGFVLAVLLIPLVVGLVILLVWYLRCKSTRLQFAGNDLTLEKGLLSKARTELDARGIRTVKVYQSFFDRVFGVGRISIFTAGDTPEIEVSGLPRPNDLRELIKAAQDA